ncbi:LOW QUALITY PROTEIN: E3 ubiquitin-protein ligase RNF103-like [Limulus polyphemus]|uniref:LOW QUALITY PROTEIN: E3 ubiquitin-protein ligase RNF103-like n=1 Tax=Limulus polyphemus TaxID=6850 RepID=A0ABM1BME2_LIMPO|nr:LOW QUALITY PROTEIN: E3 ubiquitin-protein ligase RNF103-like [Limulus polyphemus]
MWFYFRLVLLAFYFLLLFFLSRLLEAVSWYQGNSTFFYSRQILEPISLSVLKLKQILESRGISYAGVVEKQELTALVESSGEVVQEELDSAIETENSSSRSSVFSKTTKSTHFTCGSHFYEEVEDTKDSVWLVQVIPSGLTQPLLDTSTWKQVISKVSRFGVRTGIFECSLDERLCARKKWTMPQLVLALPRGHRAKQEVVLHSYLFPAKAQAVVQWIRHLLATRIKMVGSPDELENHWLKYSPETPLSEVRVILLSTMSQPPLFLSSLAIKFTGRIRFGLVNISENNKIQWKKKLKVSKFPIYLIVTPEKTVVYGHQCGEILNFESMDLFLKWLRPEMNDIFLLSLFIVNIFTGFGLFLLSGKIWKHVIHLLFQIIKCNCVLFLVWLLVIGLFQFPFMETTSEFCLKVVRYLSGTPVASLIRYDWKLHLSSYLLFVTFIVLGTISGVIWKKLGYNSSFNESFFFADWWTDPWEGYILSYLFRPMATLSRPMVPQDLDLEEGMELLIGRLVVPNLWLQPVYPTDYIKDLPVWTYCGWCTSDDKMHKVEMDAQFNYEHTKDMENSKIMSEELAHPLNYHLAKQDLKPDSGQVLMDSNVKTKIKDCDCSTTAERRLSSNYWQSSDVSDEENHGFQSPNDDKQQRTPLGMLECRECAICLERYHYGVSLCGLPCGHNYHCQCIMAWLCRDSCNHCCPVCRWPCYKPRPKVS